ncbi:Uncharacterized protein APZ42_033629 [Daphnia magna]|uniref:Uncharacterized protein n=1 Tax=Daphnia magna TaxID=35525 RepID=A0A164KY73_9CRUS|nr:Uncharacterized protein APZ42_033629 [Daphnia magna]
MWMVCDPPLHCCCRRVLEWVLLSRWRDSERHEDPEVLVKACLNRMLYVMVAMR